MTQSIVTELLDGLTRGGRLDSRGEFSVDYTAAWRKMGEFQLPFQGAWVLKLAQAAERQRCLLDVTQVWKTTEFLFHGWFVSREELKAVLLSPKFGEAPESLSHLGVALRALAQTESLPFTIEYHDGGADLWDGRSLCPIEEGTEELDGLRVTISHLPTGSSTTMMSVLRRARLEPSTRIARILASHCCWRETLIRLDGRILSDYLLDPHFGSGSLRRPLLLLRADGDDSYPRLRCAVSSSISPVGHRAQGEFDVSPCLAAALVTVFLERGSGLLDSSIRPGKNKSVFTWIRDGVEVDEEVLATTKGSVAIKVVCSAGGLETDLSGLVPRRSAELHARRKAALEAILSRLRQAHSADFPLDLRVHTGGSISGLLGAGMLLALEPFVGLMMLGLYGMGQNDRRKFELEITLAVERGLKTLIHDLERSLERMSLEVPSATAPNKS